MNTLLDAAGIHAAAESTVAATTHGTTAFLDALASAEPTPGGGGAAALMGAMGAALVSMVCRLTLGRRGHEAHEAEMRAMLAESEALRARMTALIAEDAAAYGTVMAAYRLPRETDAEKAARRTAIQHGLTLATEAPLACARAAAEGLRLAARAVEHGNANAAGDAGVGLLSCWAALRSAALNVGVNAPHLADRVFADAAAGEIAVLLAEWGPLVEQVHARATARL